MGWCSGGVRVADLFGFLSWVFCFVWHLSVFCSHFVLCFCIVHTSLPHPFQFTHVR
jgi:hypothetical protein